MVDWEKYLYPHQQEAIINKKDKSKCLVNMWCGTGKTRTFTTSLFQDFQDTNVIVFPSLDLINQYNNDYFLNQNKIFKEHFDKFQCLAFCSDDDTKLKLKASTIKYSTSEKTCKSFMKQKGKKFILVTYHSFEKFINICYENEYQINRLIFDEAHHVVGEKLQEIVFNNERLDNIVDKTEYYTATPVNKNGITMYDREEPENSDCGELAYEYLYYKAVEDKVCKAFTTNIGLYCIKPEYKNKYQPIFELIIRACLSGEYEYWNVLTYHTYVNEKDSTNGISYVKDFASKENQRLFKSLFNTIQNEEFTDTKSQYHIDNVLLKGVSSETKNREKIIEEFDKKVPGRIYILASCGILNEGIDTKWANMGVPINPSKSIVKETQRIGRLVRIPENNMPKAVILIPCLIDIEKYKDLNNLEEQDKMIRQELSETGNFNTALNVISAFKYQYDPELYEMCLIYPNMYAPQEIKDNLSKYGLIVEESRGDLVDNLKYMCEEFDINRPEGMSDDELLNSVGEELEKSIEIHTQDYDEPIKIINRECCDDEPIRLFYSSDDKCYSPIIKKEKNRKIKREDIKSPKKRKAIFNIHTHPDLDVMWNIKDVKLNKQFGQGVLDVNINWNEKRWEENYEILKKYMLENNNICVTENYVTECGIKIGSWISNQRHNKLQGKLSQYRIDRLELLDGWYWKVDFDKVWNANYEKVKDFIDKYNKRPSNKSKCENERFLGSWIGTQRLILKNINMLSEKSKNHTILNNNEFQTKFEALIENNKELFIDKNDAWFKRLKDVANYIDIHKRRPSNKDKDKKISVMGSWVIKQNRYYNENKSCMNSSKRKEWKNFRYKYEKYFQNNEENWNDNYKLLCEYIDINQKRPSMHNTNDEKAGYLGRWITTQFDAFYKKIGVFKEEKYIEIWKNFINKYKKYQLDNLTTWDYHFDLVEEYVKINNKSPTRYITSDGKKLGTWIHNQRTFYKKNKLTPYQISKLETLANWTWSSGIIYNRIDWEDNYNLLKKYMLEKNNQCPMSTYITADGIKLGVWVSKIRQDKKANKLSKDKINKLEQINGWWWTNNYDEIWNEKYEYLKKYILVNKKLPTLTYRDDKFNGHWISDQRSMFIKKKMEQYKINKLEELPGWYWISTKKDMSKPIILPKKEPSTKSTKPPPKSELSELHKKYKTMSSQNLNKQFNDNKEEWEKYHEISKQNEQSFPEEDIPRNRIIKKLETFGGKRKKEVVDLGCGYGEISQYFKDNNRFVFQNFDHVAINDTIISKDIKNTELDDTSVDIVIMCLSMWGSNCKDYLKEAYRILDIGGTLYIVEPYKRWNDNEENKNRLVELLKENNFVIAEQIDEKFMYIECRK